MWHSLSLVFDTCQQLSHLVVVIEVCLGHLCPVGVSEAAAAAYAFGR